MNDQARRDRARRYQDRPGARSISPVRRAARHSRENCAPCHGAGGGGAKGYPNLNDDDWLWGGTLEQIQQTIEFGIRSGHQKARESQMPAFGSDGMLKRDEIANGRELSCARSPSLPTRAGRRPWRRQEGLRRQLRGLSRRRRQGQPRARRAEPDRRHLAVRLRRGRDHRDRHQLARRRDAGLGRTARSDDHQGARRLRPLARRRGEVSRGRWDDQRSDDSGLPGRRLRAVRARPKRRGEARRAEGRPLRLRSIRRRTSGMTRRSTRRAARSIRSASPAPTAASNGRCCSSRSASITRCRSCAGIAGRTRPTRRC